MNPFQTGDVVTINSVAFQNVALRGDGSRCDSNNSCNCGTVNTQYTVGSWEKWNLFKQSDGSFCIANNNFPNAFLSFDGSNCSSMTGPGCGSVNLVYKTSTSCSGKEAFRFVNQGNGKYAIRSDWKPNAFLRIDGAGVTAFSGPGAGNVNGQFYSSGPQGGYEVFTITKV